MDVSADLTELGRTPVAVISSGCKSFLDIPRTLEYLETQGVTVCTFKHGRTGDIDIPAFYTRESGIKSPLVVRGVKDAAAMICKHPHVINSRSQRLLNKIQTPNRSPTAQMAFCSQIQFPKNSPYLKTRLILPSIKLLKKRPNKVTTDTKILRSFFLGSKNLLTAIAYPQIEL